MEHLWKLLAGLHDKRRRGLRHPLQTVMVVALKAMVWAWSAEQMPRRLSGRDA